MSSYSKRDLQRQVERTYLEADKIRSESLLLARTWKRSHQTVNTAKIAVREAETALVTCREQGMSSATEVREHITTAGIECTALQTHCADIQRIVERYAASVEQMNENVTVLRKAAEEATRAAAVKRADLDAATAAGKHKIAQLKHKIMCDQEASQLLLLENEKLRMQLLP